MAKVDMHVHSKFSNHPSEWFLQKLGTAESYTEPEYIYQKAKERGMNFVTLTDHNTIDGGLILKETHPNDFFISNEATAYFPDERCKIHVLTYNITENQFKEIDKVRENVYEFRDYLKANNIAYSIAHATYAVNKKYLLKY